MDGSTDSNKVQPKDQNSMLTQGYNNLFVTILDVITSFQNIVLEHVNVIAHPLL
jgi:hypothetical protein